MENLRQVQVLTNPSRRIMVDGKHEGKFTEAKYELGAFHKWEDYKSDEISEVRAVVEFEDGRV